MRVAKKRADCWHHCVGKTEEYSDKHVEETAKRIKQEVSVTQKAKGAAKVKVAPAE
jgi:hypothetical protein